MEDTDSMRIVLVGKTGSGKSSLANTIFGVKDMFQVTHKSISGDKTCEVKTQTVNGRSVQLIDTPGFLSTDPTDTNLNPEIIKCITECAPGLHAFLFLLKVEKFTSQEQALVDLMLTYFSDQALRYTTVAFTHGNQLLEGQTIEEWFGDNEPLKKLVQKCGGRCHVFDNRYWNEGEDPYRNNQVQVQELFKTIDKTLRQNGDQRCYSNEVLQRIGDDVEQQMQQLTRCSPAPITLRDIHQRALQVVYKKVMNNMQGAMCGLLLGAFFGQGVMVRIVARGSPGSLQCVAAVVGAVGGGLVGVCMSDRWDSPGQFLQEAADFLMQAQRLVHAANQLYQTGAPLIYPQPPDN